MSKFLIIISIISFTYSQIIEPPSLIWNVSTSGSDEIGDGSQMNPFATIQKAIDEMDNGDLIHVASGTYVENIICDKSIKILGAGIDETIVDGGGIDRVFDISISGSTLNISNLTIQNGRGERKGGGLKFESTGTGQAKLVINECHFYNNHTVYSVNDGFEDMTGGGAIFINSNDENIDTIKINNCIFNNNYAVFAQDEFIDIGYGGAINLWTGVHLKINNSLFINNSAGSLGNSIYKSSGGSLHIINSILFDQTYPLDCNNCANIEVNYSNINGGWQGENNIDSDPLFCDSENGDFTIAENSPCVNNGQNESTIGPFDVGCDAVNLAPEITPILDQESEEDIPFTVNVYATSTTDSELSYFAQSDTSALFVFMENSIAIIQPQDNWSGIGTITVTVSDENNLSDTTDFEVSILPINDPPGSFSLIYPTLSDTLLISPINDEVYTFRWEPSIDIDSDIQYMITLSMDYLGENYTNEYFCNDSFVDINTNYWSVLMTNLELFVSNFNYIVQATDGEYTIDSEIGEVVFENSSLSSIEVVPPNFFSLQQNYPNPFNPFTTIFYEISGATYVKIIVYDLLGNVVKYLLNNYESEGKKSIVWNGRNNMNQEVSAGVYIYTMIANSNVQTKKMLLVK